MLHSANTSAKNVLRERTGRLGRAIYTLRFFREVARHPAADVWQEKLINRERVALLIASGGIRALFPTAAGAVAKLKNFVTPASCFDM